MLSCPVPTPLIAALPGAVSVLIIIPGLDQHTVHWPGLPSISLPWYLIINLLQTVRAETVKVCLVAALSLDRQQVAGLKTRGHQGGLQQDQQGAGARLQAGDRVVEINGDNVLKILSFSWPPLLSEGGGAQGSPSHPRPPGRGGGEPKLRLPNDGYRGFAKLNCELN